MIDVPLLRKALTHITLHPKEWKQDVWVRQTPGCGTAGCLAGTVVLMLSDVQLNWHTQTVVTVDTLTTYLESETAYVHGQFHSIENLARETLGLTDLQALVLFREHNSLALLWKLAETYTRGEIQASELAMLLETAET